MECQERISKKAIEKRHEVERQKQERLMSTTKPKHTATWRVIKKDEWEKLHQDGAHYFASVADDTGNLICQCANKNSLTTAQSRAEHIVKCVNSHDELVEALKVALPLLEVKYKGDDFGWKNYVEPAKQALEKVGVK